MSSISKAVLVAAAALVVCVPQRAPAATVNYDVALSKGVSETYNGDHFKFTGSGTMSFDDVANSGSFNIQLSNGLAFTGNGPAAITPKGRVFGLVSTTSMVNLAVVNGTAIVVGSTNKDRSKFSVAITAAVPNRLGIGPAGFVVSKMKVKGKKQ